MKQNKQIASKGNGIKRATIRVERLILRKATGTETSVLNASFKTFRGSSPAAALLKGLKYIKQQSESFEPAVAKLTKGDEIIMFVRLMGTTDENVEGLSFNISHTSMGWLNYLINDLEKSYRIHKRKSFPKSHTFFQ